MYMNQTSLKVLEYVQYSDSITYDIYPSPKGFLKNLTKLTFSSNISPELLINLAQTCHNLFLLDVIIIYHIPKELVDLITIQKNLKCFSMMIHDGLKDEIDSIPLLTMELPKTLTRFVVVGENYNISLSFLVNFTNLQELEISFDFNWKKRIPQKPLSFVIIDSAFCKNRLDKNVENMKIIETYTKLGVVKNFEIGDYS
ncbi:hypothetical protein RhiirA5_507945 [Rhizophagus irregularis]|uniref:Uncharacterized protein n=1 Tax=Rhizophagus irregularis TaxID=588596 RepID=A0A2N0NG59_9GLOM|nr:hypothetical protein RhiirA5_507945 [Rhizophagus irregularis]